MLATHAENQRAAWSFCQQPCAGKLYESLALAAYRQLVLSYAREAQADAAKRADFAKGFPGVSVGDKGLEWNGRVYDLARSLRDELPHNTKRQRRRSRS